MTDILKRLEYALESEDTLCEPRDVVDLIIGAIAEIKRLRKEAAPITDAAQADSN